MASSTVAAIGEVMVEFAPATANGETSGENAPAYKLGFAGDTFNTAVSLARLGLPTAYVTLLGDDPFSDRVLHLMSGEGLDTRLVARRSGRQPGLYVIANDEAGERTFHYWRSEAPARELWADDGLSAGFEEALGDYGCIYLSGITLAIMQPPARERLSRFLAGYREHGGRFAFDSNYRPRLWQTPDAARTAIGGFTAMADIALLTLEDEQALWGVDSAKAVIERHGLVGVPEVVVKQGAGPVLIGRTDGVESVQVPEAETVVDTTGAGDAFNAGYLASRLRGDDPVKCGIQGIRAAAVTLSTRGGIPPRDFFLKEMAPDNI